MAYGAVVRAQRSLQRSRYKAFMRNHATPKQLRGFVKEEKATAKLYKRLGFKRQGEQESGHAKFFASKLKRK